MKFILPLLAASLLTAHAQNALTSASAFNAGEGVNGTVNALAVQTDGKIVIGGSFSSVNGVPRQNVARLNTDGTLDAAFLPETANGVNGQVNALAIDSTGGIIVGGAFSQANSQEALSIARYKTDGTLDKEFGGKNSQPGTNGTVYALAVQADGKILVGGNFTEVFGKQFRAAARLLPDGTPDVALPSTATPVTGAVKAAVALSEGGVLGGAFEIPGQNAKSLLSAQP
jgi:trimeric autotransporter adhesin